jgi:hypothetical protein
MKGMTLQLPLLLLPLLLLFCSYDDEFDTYENDVTATTRGRGPAEAGQINIAIAPNDDSSVSGSVKATAAQGAAVAGAFTLTNAANEAYQGINVSARKFGDSVRLDSFSVPACGWHNNDEIHGHEMAGAVDHLQCVVCADCR